MIVNRMLRWLSSNPLGDIVSRGGIHALYADAIRHPVVCLVDRWIGHCMVQAAQASEPWSAIGRQRWLIFRAVLHTVDRMIGQRLLSPRVASIVAQLWGRALATPPDEIPAARSFRAEYGVGPPWFLVISPGHACNLHCAGCYAASDESAGAKLPWSILDRLMTEAKKLWGVPLFVFSGGEPLAYRSQGKDLLDAVVKHSDCLYLMFTNGTLINRQVARRLAQMGNVTPAVSIEGPRDLTDARRGLGVFDQAVAAMAHLRQAGVPFGMSVTVTRENNELLLSDRFLDWILDEQGAFYLFLFQYVPIGRDADASYMLTPEQSLAFWRRSWEVVERKRAFLLDFGNHGPLVEGCIAAGRDRGYLHIDWNGNVMPCVFIPYAADNIRDVYARGGNLNDVWDAPFFRAIRAWQREYGYGADNLTGMGNWLRPCPFKDHHAVFRRWLDCYSPQPQEGIGDGILNDAYARAMMERSEASATLWGKIWDETYLGKTPRT